MKLSEIREQISCIDKQLIDLIALRANLAKQAFEQKLKLGQTNPFSPEREEEVFKRASDLSENTFGVSAKPIFTEIVSLCRSLEKPTKIVILESELPNVAMATIQRFGNYVNIASVRELNCLLDHVVEKKYLGFIRAKTDTYNKVIKNSRIRIIYDYLFQPRFKRTLETYVLIQLK